VPRSNPIVKDRLAAVNAKLCNSNNFRSLFVNSRCIHLIQDFEQVTTKAGGGDFDKSNLALTHISDGIGYMIATEFPIISKQIQGIKHNVFMR